LLLAWLLAGASLAQVPMIVEAGTPEISDDVRAEADEALAALDRGEYPDAARRLQALAEAGTSAELWRVTAVAWFEAGQLDRADAAVTSGLAIRKDLGGLLVLLGAIRTEQGRADEALKALDAALAAPDADAEIRAAARYDRGLTLLERGDLTAARTELDQAVTLAGQAGDAKTSAAAAEQLGRIDGMSGPTATADAMGAISDALARGDLVAARAAIPRVPESDRRGRIRALIGEAAVDRAEGRFDAAIPLLAQAIANAREGGLIREHAAALAELGTAYAAAGQYDLARPQLDGAVKLVAGTSFRLFEASYRASAGTIDARVGDLAAAKDQLAKGRAALGATADVGTRARLDELAGMIASAGGDLTAAKSSFEAAKASFEQLHAWEDAARVCTSEVELFVGRDEAAAADAKKAAKQEFARSGNPVGDAWIALSEAVGRSRSGDADGTMAALADAKAAAKAAGGDRGARFAAIAEENARHLLAGAAADPAARARAANLGFDDIVSSYTTYGDATSAFQAGTSAYDAHNYALAAERFDHAFTLYQQLGETSRAGTARRNRALARFNDAIGSHDPATQLETWNFTAAEAKAFGDPDLEVRSLAAAAQAAADLAHPDAKARLLECATRAQAIGMISMAAACDARRAEVETDVPASVAAAEEAWALSGGDANARYAVYVAAVKAYQAENYPLAYSLAHRVDDHPEWKLHAAVLEVRDAAKQMLSQ
jgi:tetratricopeptide (TPR) repeat protein